MKYFLSLLFTLFLISNTFSQKKDSTYIESYPQKMMITLTTSRKTIELKQNNNQYTPNVPLNYGIGLLVRNTIIDLELGSGVSLNGDVNQKTKITDFQLHHYGRKFLLDLAYQKYKGFYQGNTEDEFLPNYSVAQVGVEGSYLFNGDKLSAKAAFTQSEKQLKSAGSFLVGSCIYFHQIHNEGDLLYSQENISNYQVGLTGGYAYSWVINKNWLLSTINSIGVSAVDGVKYIKTSDIKMYPTVYSLNSIGYHKTDWGFAFSMLIRNKSVNYVDNNSISITSLNMQLSFMKNFDLSFKKKKQNNN